MPIWPLGSMTRLNPVLINPSAAATHTAGTLTITAICREQDTVHNAIVAVDPIPQCAPLQQVRRADCHAKPAADGR
jgi:hypothetical protein